MKKVLSTLALAAALAAPGAAFAGTSTSTGTATLTVVNQCEIAGANVNLGTYLASQNWGDVAEANGYITDGGSTQVSGTMSKTLNLGSITCDSGTPYLFNIKGTAPQGRVRIVVGANTAAFTPYVNDIGGQVVPDGVAVPGTGWGMSAVGTTPNVPGVGSGVAQQITGSMIQSLVGTTYGNSVGNKANADTVVLGTVGTFTDTLSYQLDF